MKSILIINRTCKIKYEAVTTSACRWASSWAESASLPHYAAAWFPSASSCSLRSTSASSFWMWLTIATLRSVVTRYWTNGKGWSPRISWRTAWEFSSAWRTCSPGQSSLIPGSADSTYGLSRELLMVMLVWLPRRALSPQERSTS